MPDIPDIRLFPVRKIFLIRYRGCPPSRLDAAPARVAGARINHGRIRKPVLHLRDMKDEEEFRGA
jgi:hypothetical protein